MRRKIKLQMGREGRARYGTRDNRTVELVPGTRNLRFRYWMGAQNASPYFEIELSLLELNDMAREGLEAWERAGYEPDMSIWTEEERIAHRARVREKDRKARLEAEERQRQEERRRAVEEANARTKNRRLFDDLFGGRRH